METVVEVVCPFCGEVSTIHVEVGAPEQRYYEMCEICCRPIHVEVRFDANYEFDVQIRRSSGH